MQVTENRPWQVRLLGPSGKPVGGGVLVADEHVLTCAHVVRDALGENSQTEQAPGGSVLVDFVASEAGPLLAGIESWADVGDDGQGDVAVLRLAGPAPPGAEPAPVRWSEGLLGHRFDVLGFPRGYDDGISSSGTVRRPAGGGGEWVELSVPAGTLVERGFSGSPVLDEDLGAVVGIVVGSDRDREHRVAWMIPVSTLIRYWPPLEGIARHWSMYPRNEFTSHWSPRSRGVARHSSRGSFFTGRRRVIQELSGWLAAGRADGLVRAVTGGPGSGKSAVLARLAVLGDPVARNLIGDDLETPVPSIDVAVYARGKTTADVLSAIAAAIGMPSISPETWVDDLARRGRPLTVLVDALDEAAEPLETSTLLRRTAALGQEDGPVKVLVGTRRGYEQELLRQLGSGTVVLDLDDEAYLDPADITEYVQRRLTARGGAYHDQGEQAHEVAEAIAVRSYPSFLLAQLSTTALALSGPVDVGVPGWESRFAGSVADGWHDYLDRFGEDRRRVQDLLMPLAHARGSGLGTDDGLWLGLASALSGRRYEVQDIDWLLEHAAAYLVQELVQEDHSVYRLYHQTLLDYLRGVGRGPEALRRIVRHLVEEVPRPDERREWTQARPYTRVHLSTHAADAGMLDELVSDSLFLAAAEPGRLSRALRRVTGEPGRAIATAYQDALPELGASIDDNVNHLALAAHLNGLPDLAQRLSRLQPQVPLLVTWAVATSAARSHYLADAPGGVAGVEPFVLDGHTYLAVCALDGAVRIWDADGYAAQGPALPLPDTVGTPFLTAGTLDGRPILATGHHDRLCLLELVTGPQTVTAEVFWTLRAPDVSITAAAVSMIGGVPVVAIGFHDGVIELQALDGTSEATLWQMHEGPVLSAHFVGVDLLTAGADGAVVQLKVAGTQVEETRAYTVTQTWANAARLSSTSEHGTVLAAGYSDGFLGWWREGAQEAATHLKVNAPTEFGTHQEFYADGLFTTTTTGMRLETLADVVEAWREDRRREESARDWETRYADIGDDVAARLPGPDGALVASAPPPEPVPASDGDVVESPIVIDVSSPNAQEGENVRILELRAGTTSVDVTTVGSQLLVAAGGYDGRVLLVEDGGENHLLQAEGPAISSIRFVDSGDHCSLVAADRGAGGAVRSWSLDAHGAPLSEDRGNVPDFMSALPSGTGAAVLVTWATGQDVSLHDVRTGAVTMLGTDLAGREVISMTTGYQAGEAVVLVVVRVEPGRTMLLAWSVNTHRLLVEQQLPVQDEPPAEQRPSTEQQPPEDLKPSGLYLHGDSVVAAVGGGLVRWPLREPDPRPTSVALQRTAHWESLFADSSPPSISGRIRRVPGGPPHLVYAVSDYWQEVVVVDLEEGTVESLTEAYGQTDAATSAMIDGHPAALEAENGVVTVSRRDPDSFGTSRLAALKGAQPSQITVLVASPEAALVAAGGVDGTVRVWQHLSTEPDVFALRSPVRYLEIVGDDEILVLCMRGLVSLRVTPRSVARLIAADPAV